MKESMVISIFFGPFQTVNSVKEKQSAVKPLVRDSSILIGSDLENIYLTVFYSVSNLAYWNTQHSRSLTLRSLQSSETDRQVTWEL